MPIIMLGAGRFVIDSLSEQSRGTSVTSNIVKPKACPASRAEMTEAWSTTPNAPGSRSPESSKDLAYPLTMAAPRLDVLKNANRRSAEIVLHSVDEAERTY